MSRGAPGPGEPEPGGGAALVRAPGSPPGEPQAETPRAAAGTPAQRRRQPRATATGTALPGMSPQTATRELSGGHHRPDTPALRPGTSEPMLLPATSGTAAPP